MSDQAPLHLCGCATREIEGFPGYRVSEDGTIWSCLVRGVAGGMSDRWKPRRPKPDKDGYLTINLRRDGRSHWRKVHNLVLCAFVGPKATGQECRHLNGNNQDNRLSNLCWGTPTQNRMDSFRHGSKVGPWKLDLEKAKAVKQALGAGGRVCQLARQFGVGRHAIRYIAQGRCMTLESES